MRTVELAFEEHPFLNKEANDYLQEVELLKHFYAYPPSINSIPDVIAKRSGFPLEKREILVNQIHKQYDGIGVSKDHLIRNQIDSLRDQNTFTITTGQQIHIALGPLFFIYKILSCIDIADDLNRRFPDFKFVPVFWMATEDHDFEEINYVKLYGQTYSWEDFQDGAVGRYNTSSLSDTLDKLRERLDDTDENMQMMDLFSDVYSKNKTLATATHDLIHRLLGHRGLVVLDPDNVELKKEFSVVITDDVIHGANYEPLDEYSKKLKNSGYDLQINPQNVNHFIFNKGKRLKLKNTNGEYQVIDNESITPETLKRRISDHPEDFSPNVVMRPLYQEVILPNLIYIPGGSELRYWLQLKGVFDQNKVPFPMIIPRSSAVVISDKTYEQLLQAGGDLREMFLSENDMASIYGAKSNSPVKLIKEKLKEFQDYIDTLPPELQRLTPHQATPIKNLKGIDKNLNSVLSWLEDLPVEVKGNDPSFNRLLKIKRRFFDLTFPQERDEFCINYLSFIKKLTTENSTKGLFKECRNLNVLVTKSI